MHYISSLWIHEPVEMRTTRPCERLHARLEQLELQTVLFTKQIYTKNLFAVFHREGFSCVNFITRKPSLDSIEQNEMSWL